MSSKIGNAGDVTITFNGEERTLRPTLRALTAINRAYGGLAKVQAALVAQDLDATVLVLRHGLAVSDDAAKKLPEQVFQNGLDADLLVPLIRYVAILGNGGKPLAEDDGAAPGEPAGAGEGEEAAGNA